MDTLQCSFNLLKILEEKVELCLRWRYTPIQQSTQKKPIYVESSKYKSLFNHIEKFMKCCEMLCKATKEYLSKTDEIRPFEDTIRNHTSSLFSHIARFREYLERTGYSHHIFSEEDEEEDFGDLTEWVYDKDERALGEQKLKTYFQQLETTDFAKYNEPFTDKTLMGKFMEDEEHDHVQNEEEDSASEEASSSEDEFIIKEVNTRKRKFELSDEEESNDDIE